MQIERIQELLADFLPEERVTTELLHSVSQYLDILCRWNAKLNLTAVRDPEEMIRRHFGESLFAANFVREHATLATAIDIGSGAGFPGLPLKIMLPEVEVTLVESKAKKATFLREVIRSLHLSGVTVFEGRAELLAERAALVTLRAVENFEKIVVTAQEHLSEGGTLAFMIGGAQLGRAEELLSAKSTFAKEIPRSGSRIVALWS